MARPGPTKDTGSQPLIDTDIETSIGRDWPRSLALAGISAALIAISYYGVQMTPEDYRERAFQRDSYLILPAFLAVQAYVLYRLFVPFGAVVRIRPDGLIDSRAGRGLMPWDQISNVARRGAFVQITLRRGFARAYRKTLTQRFLIWRRRSAGPGHVLIVDWCLSVSQSDLLCLIETYRAAHSVQADSKQIPD